MPIKLEDYMDPQTFEKVKSFSEEKETPFLVIDTATIENRLENLINVFPQASIYYAVKANPAATVLKMMQDKDINFDIASIYELDRVLSLGISPDRICFGNTIKKSKDVRYFYKNGVRMYATDSEADIRNLAKAAPGSRIYVRILTEGTLTADWPLSRKFGCQADMAMDLIILAKHLGLIPYGISFHVGSQQRDIGAWDAAIGKVKVIFERLQEEDGIELQMINLGGGFPANYLSKAHDLEVYGQEIMRFLEESFGENMPKIILEPGRSIMGDAGVLVSEVVLISRKSRTALNRWVYLDVGKFSGLIETMGESIKYPLFTGKKGEVEEVILAGPTCDGADILYEDYKYKLPLNLAIGDRIYLLSTGAYTNSYSAIEFNGFPPLETYFI